MDFSITCAPNYYRYSLNNTCLQTCPNSYYKNDTLQACALCDTSCKTCLYGNNTSCLSCIDGSFLNNI